ncbi:MAG: selenocysteine-specific translation elongation factor, partial [Campylobacterota bacterium]
MQNLIIGTIGHIDHGKTSLVKQITGFDGDSTQQEKQRGITIDISFSHLQSPKKNITFIDMPGHEDLVKNMIAGAFGLDGVLCVIAANEGIKPQTIEHLQICKFLGLQNFIIVLTKCDLADEETISARKDEVKILFQKLQLRYSEPVQCSIYDTSSIEKLHKLLVDHEKSVKDSLDFFRYFIDRVFSIKGSGTVVTGTVLGGEVKLKQKLVVAQLQKDVEVKAIQTAHASAEVAPIATRVALNLAKIDTKDLKRGMQLCAKGFLRGFKKIEALVELLDSDETLHNREFEFYHGAS